MNQLSSPPTTQPPEKIDALTFLQEWRSELPKHSPLGNLIAEKIKQLGGAV